MRPARFLSLVLCVATIAPGAWAYGPNPPHVTGFELSGTQFAAGDRLDVTANVTAPGGNLIEVKFAFYLLGTITWVAAEWHGYGGNGTYVASYNVTGNETSGTYELVYVYSHAGDGQYTQDYDNVTYPDGSPVLIEITTDNAAAPDLEPYSLSTSGTPMVGTGVEVTTNVFNDGTANASAFDVVLLDNGAEVARQTVASLAASRGSVRSFAWTPGAPGNRTLTVVVDADEEVAELDETNNERSLVVHVAASQADLLIASTSMTPASPRVGNVVTFNATLRNVGSSNAPSSELAFFLNGAKRAGTFVVGLAPNASTNVTFSFVPTVAGSYNAAFLADAAGNVTESNESNNNATRGFAVLPALQPDLRALSFSATPPSAPAGRTTSIVGRIGNNGTAPSSGFVAELRVDGQAIAAQWIPGLAIGANATISGNWTFTEGWHYAVLVVDPSNAVPESDEGNNVAGRELIGFPAVDVAIRIASVEHEPLTTELGDAPHPFPRHYVTLEVRNHAWVSVHAVWNLTAEADTRLVEQSTTDRLATGTLDLAANQTRTIVVVWEPIGAVGDVDLMAEAYLPGEFEPHLANNVDRRSDFVLVGGLGGIVVPA